MLKISVVICTHNPNSVYLGRTLLALSKQSFNLNQWELIIVDNASNTAVANLFDVSWHPLGIHVREENLGLSAARHRGIIEANADLILFVDDDNCLDENYLAILTKFMDEMPLLGVLGAGKIIPEFESAPTVVEIPFLRSLALRNENRAHFSNDLGYHKALPFGAGMCIRRSVGLGYVQSYKTRNFVSTLGRKGGQLLSGEDIDLALHACQDGFLAGVLPELTLIHLIPKARLEHEYLVKIAAGHAASNYLLSKIWSFEKYPENQIIKWSRYWKKRFTSKGLERRILIAEYQAENVARRNWRQKKENRPMVKLAYNLTDGGFFNGD